MSWWRGDDQVHDDPDVDLIGAAAVCLHFMAMSWCARNLTDGRVPKARVQKLKGGDDPQALTDLLSDHSDFGGGKPWWVEVDGHYQIRNYLKYNPSRNDVLAARTRSSERVEKWRNGRGTNEPGNGACNGVTDDITNAGNNATVTGAPVPSPRDPDPDPPAKAGEDARRADSLVDDDADDESEQGGVAKSMPKFKPADFERFIEAFPASGRKKACDAWDALRPSPAVLAEIDRSLAPYSGQKYSAEDRSLFCGPSVYLNQRRWQDDDPFPAFTRAMSERNGSTRAPAIRGSPLQQRDQIVANMPDHVKARLAAGEAKIAAERAGQQ